MQTPILADNEKQRPSMLQALQILDTSSEERFDCITRLARSFFEAPIVLLSFVDVNHQWFKSFQGLSLSETPRYVSFCSHTLLSQNLSVIPDTLMDVRFADNPLVTADPWIRFYAGCPLYALDGSIIGSLCIFDRQPRAFSAVDQQVLRDLGHWAEKEVNAVQISQPPLQGEYEARRRSIRESAYDVAMLLEKDQYRLTVNRCFSTFFGIPFDETSEFSWFDIEAQFAGLFANPQEVSQLILELLAEPEGKMTEVILQCSPENRSLELSSAPMFNSNKEYQGRLYIFRDITERAAMLATLQHQANYDLLTDLPNRIFLQKQMEFVLLAAENEENSTVLLVFDVDRFKEVNDTFGHQQGDLLLSQVSARLRHLLSILPFPGIVARLGGDEFALFLSNAEKEQADAIVQALQRVFEESFIVADMLLQIDVAIGIVLSPTHGKDAQTLLRRADIAMYIAKRTRSGSAFYDPSIDKSSLRRLTIISALREALASNTLQLYYQPKADVKTGAIQSVEALARWIHPTYGFIPPDEFIVLAEQIGLIAPLTLWVLETAIKQCQAWRDAGLEIAISVNLSMWNLRDLDLPDTIGAMLQSYGVPASLLCVELTEGAVMSDINRTVEVLNRLVALGICVSVDDFGTGYSSLAYLKRLPIHELKIDRSFVQFMATNQTDATIVRSTVSLAHNLGLQVVAEGVEDAIVWNLLLESDCDVIQGYFLSRPIPSAEFEQWLRTREDLDKSARCQKELAG